jgi:hypothetical protein
LADNQIVQQQTRALTMNEEIAFANTVAGGNLLPRAYQNNPANVVIAVNLGQSMGLSPAESLYRINVINGKPTASAELIAAQVRKAGHKLRIKKDEKNLSVTATIVRCDDPDYPISVTRDASWAKQMGLASKDNYRKQPLTMLTWRAITAAAREACPEALYGVAYTPDEMHDFDRPEPRRVDAQVTNVQQDVQAADLSEVRALFKDYMAARGGIAPNDATSELCQFAGVADMHDMTQEQADATAEAMKQTISQAFENDQSAEDSQDEPVEPDMYEEDVEF